MIFRRKSRTTPTDSETSESTEANVPAADAPLIVDGPYDIDDAPDGLVDDSWVDLGSLVLAPVEGRELRLQVNEQTGAVGSVMIASSDGALELRAFASPKSDDLWSEALPVLRADIAKRGGEIGDREGPWGPEIISRLKVTTPEGKEGTQASRMVGVDGGRWMLRATFLGKPAINQEAATEWEQILRTVVVRRGNDPKPKGEALSLVVPPQVRPASDGEDAPA